MHDILNEVFYEMSNLLKVVLGIPIFVLAVYNVPIGLIYLFGVRFAGFELVHEKKGRRFADMGARELVPMAILVSAVSTLMYLGIYFIFLKV